MIRLNQAFILVIALASGLSSESWAAEDGQMQVIDVQSPSQAFGRSISQKSDHDLNTLLATKWDDLDVHGQRMRKNTGNPTFVLHDGPPYANGDLHHGHMLNKTPKKPIFNLKWLLYISIYQMY